MACLRIGLIVRADWLDMLCSLCSPLDLGRRGSGVSERPPLSLDVGLSAAADTLQGGPGKDRALQPGRMGSSTMHYNNAMPDLAAGSAPCLDNLPWGPGSASDGLAFEEEDDEPSQPDSAAQATSLNNRVGGGAGKRLSLQELQASLCS